jgi:molybdopterin converting factor small subunit
MKIKVIAPVKLEGLDRDDSLDVVPGTRVRDLLQRAGPAGRFMGLLPIMVNGKQVDPAHALAEGDVVVFVFPRAGG